MYLVTHAMDQMDQWHRGTVSFLCRRSRRNACTIPLCCVSRFVDKFPIMFWHFFLLAAWRAVRVKQMSSDNSTNFNFNFKAPSCCRQFNQWNRRLADVWHRKQQWFGNKETKQILDVQLRYTRTQIWCKHSCIHSSRGAYFASSSLRSPLMTQRE